MMTSLHVVNDVFCFALATVSIQMIELSKRMTRTTLARIIWYATKTSFGGVANFSFAVMSD